jgi:hypothetical protein
VTSCDVAGGVPVLKDFIPKKITTSLRHAFEPFYEEYIFHGILFFLLGDMFEI